METTSTRGDSIVSFIRVNYGTVTVGDFAERINLTPEYTSKIIKEETGRTFTELRSAVRISKAKEMLRETNLPVRVISQSMGYKHPEHFIRLFRREVGTTHFEYRLMASTSRANQFISILCSKGGWKCQA